MKRLIGIFVVIFLCLNLSFFLHPEEGMIPLSEIHKLDLKALGFQLAPTELYNPNGISLIDGIINLRGCTASFVSPDGLLLTNYHCAFRAIQSVTTKEKDYMRDGFIANNRSEEVTAENYTVRVIESYREVSKEVLSVVKKEMDYAQRTKAIEKKIKEIELAIEKKYPGRRAEVAEMFRGKTYVLFVYTYLKDIRLVYAPPRSIGEFGGEIDNWMWPRHTGDFAFLRAYTAADGAFADYSPDNVPYHPKKYLQLAPAGVKEEDFVFLLGYPGRTHRHRTSYFISFEEEVIKPYIVNLYRYMINLLEEMSQKDRTVEIKLSSRLKGLWNRMKRYRGQLKGMKNLKLAQRRKQKEDVLQEFIDADPQRREKYGNLLEQLKNHYDEKRKDAGYDLLLDHFLRSSTLLNNAYKVYEASIEREKKDAEQESAYMDRNFDRTLQRMKRDLRNFYEPVDKILLKEMFLRAIKLKDKGYPSIPAVEEIIKNSDDAEKAIDAFIETTYKSSQLNDEDYMLGLLKKTTPELDQVEDPFIRLARALYPTYKKQEDKEKRQKGQLDQLLSQLIDVKKEFAGKDFIPDANSTLRLTYGRIRRYSPADAVICTPFTTLGGVVEKHTGEKPFIAPQKLIDLYQAKDLGQYVHPGLKDVPVAMLYNTDTTGGNSGSPVLNARGQLVGLNFDRVFEGTINDYAWDESYSRSIGVDVRYILWFLDKFGNANQLLKEMKVLR
ncbi:MAG: S46 family peptidase [Candidatus Aminicenantes bacterium]|jgi:hypothetical protein